MFSSKKIAVIFAVSFAFSACSNHSPTPVVQNVSTSVTGQRDSVAPGTTVAPAITAQITVNKAVLFNQTYFYEADLQYSSVYDKDLDLYTQSLAQGNIPAFFRQNGNELQLVADDRRLFPSDINHPEQIISRFKILSEAADTLTISEGDATLFLVQLTASGNDTPAGVALDHWARSFQFVAEGNYLLQESSVVLSDGTIVEMMESVYPQSTLKLSSSFQKFKMDPAVSAGSKDGAAARYRFLPGETIFNGEDKLAWAQHFDINDADTNAPITLDWYVTANAKDSDLEVIREAVEGWNRYFKSYQGIERNVLSFKGRLPDGIKIGDPRYNVINWDSRLVAGAAYESQGSDPFTGKQSHSLIYMPVAWFQIGMKYWTNGQYSTKADKEITTKDFHHGTMKPSCIRDIRGAAEAINSGRFSADAAAEFSIQLMKQTLFHEVGHSLGLAHNFKGSLSFDRTDPKSMFSTSIMDYNDYEIERAAFTSTTTADGPLLEYDRQAVSAIYNKMADVSAKDKDVPTCNDAESDNEDSGAVDPLCIRYDIEKDPTLGVKTAEDRLNLDVKENDVTLTQALANAQKTVLAADVLAATDTKDKQLALVTQLQSTLTGVLSFYVVSGKESLSKTVVNNIRSLKVFEDGILPAGYVEKDMRERAFTGVQTVFGMKALPANVVKTLGAIASSSAITLSKTTYMLALPSTDSSGLETTTKQTLNQIAKAFITNATVGLTKLRTNVFTALAHNPNLPLFFGKLGSTSFDFETAIAGLLYDTVADETRPDADRLIAATTLQTYDGRLNLSDLIQKAITKANTELKLATDNDSRELAESLLDALNGKTATK